MTSISSVVNHLEYLDYLLMMMFSLRCLVVKIQHLCIHAHNTGKRGFEACWPSSATRAHESDYQHPV